MMTQECQQMVIFGKITQTVSEKTKWKREYVVISSLGLQVGKSLIVKAQIWLVFRLGKYINILMVTTRWKISVF